MRVSGRFGVALVLLIAAACGHPEEQRPQEVCSTDDGALADGARKGRSLSALPEEVQAAAAAALERIRLAWHADNATAAAAAAAATTADAEQASGGGGGGGDAGGTGAAGSSSQADAGSGAGGGTGATDAAKGTAADSSSSSSSSSSSDTAGSGAGGGQQPAALAKLEAALAEARARVKELSAALLEAKEVGDKLQSSGGGDAGGAAAAAAAAVNALVGASGRGPPPPPSLSAAEAIARSKCPPGCFTHGVCNEELGRCDCPRQWVGADCLTPNPDIADVCANYGFTSSTCRSSSPCFNSCNGRGQCVAGFCQCTPGFWGMDCALSMAADGTVVILEGQGYTPRNNSIKVYVYELPPNITSWFNIRRLDRPLHLLFWQRLTSAGLRTANGAEADYFFLPINTRTLMLNEHARWVLSYIRTAWPYWEGGDHGQRHMIIQTGDLGVHEFHPVTRRQLNATFSNITWLTHWGLHAYHAGPKWNVATRPGKDVVIPVMITTQGFELSPLNPKVAARLKRRQQDKRTGTFFFAGRICGDRKAPDPLTRQCHTQKRLDYSAGVRQRVYFYHHNSTGFKVVPFTSSYLQDISSHKFCLAPTGGGHGKRNVLVSLMGCIPVTITDGVHQPFEPELSWAPFSVPVPEKDIPDLPRILGDIPEARVEQMQSALRCAAQHMFYSSSLGAIMGEDGRYDAFETIVEILRVRKMHPGVPPERYAEVDGRFKDFINCNLGGPDPKVLCSQGRERTYPEMPTCGECHREVVHRRTGSGFFSVAGGYVCCSELQMARCPKIW